MALSRRGARCERLAPRKSTTTRQMQRLIQTPDAEAGDVRDYPDRRIGRSGACQRSKTRECGVRAMERPQWTPIGALANGAHCLRHFYFIIEPPAKVAALPVNFKEQS